MRISNRERDLSKRVLSRWILVFLLGLAATYPLSSCKRHSPAPEGEPVFAPAVTAQVRYVIDGDTIILDTGEKIRFLGIDSPEIKKLHNGLYQGSEQPWGRDAANYLYRILSGKEIGLEKEATDADKYGRTLAYIFLNDEMVNARLLRQGYARFADYGLDLKYGEYLQEQEDVARAKKRGLWGEKKGRFKPPPYYLTSKWESYFHAPSCEEAEKIRPEDRLRLTREEAEKLGLKPHPGCLDKLPDTD